MDTEKELVERKRGWRKAVNMQVTRQACHTCRLFNPYKDSTRGFCWKMAHDLGIYIIHCPTEATNVCDEHMPNE